MPENHRRVAQSYDEIVRKTVPEPDSSWRPSADQVERAYAGERVLDPEEQKLYAKVSDALLADGGVDLSQIHIEVERSRVTLRGKVPSVSDMARVERIIARIVGVDEIVDHLVVPAE